MRRFVEVIGEGKREGKIRIALGLEVLNGDGWEISQVLGNDVWIGKFALHWDGKIACIR